MAADFWQINFSNGVRKFFVGLVGGVSSMIGICLHWIHYQLHRGRVATHKTVESIVSSGTKRYWLIYPDATGAVRTHFGWGFKANGAFEITLFEAVTEGTPGAAVTLVNQNHNSGYSHVTVIKPDNGTPTDLTIIKDVDFGEAGINASIEVGSALEHNLKFTAIDKPYCLQMETKSANVKILTAITLYEPKEEL